MRRQFSPRTLLALLCALVVAACETQVPQSPAPPRDTTPTGAAPAEAEILFLRRGDLVAFGVATGAERTLATDVRDVAAAPDGRTLALVRGDGADAELWLVGRDGAGLRRLTTNDRAEAGPRWSPDGERLVYTASALPTPTTPDWQRWSAWCAAGEVRAVAAAGGPEQPLGAGCQPAISPDGERIAFATPPTATAASAEGLTAANTITVTGPGGAYPITVATSDGTGADAGYVVYGPAWSPDGERVAYHRFLGYSMLVDISLTEETSVFGPAGVPIGAGAGWLLPPAYAPDSARVLVVSYNYSDARGFGGYEEWGAGVSRLGAMEELVLPSEPITAHAVAEDRLGRATAAAWAPDGGSIAVALPPGWSAAADEREPIFTTSEPGELWVWEVGATPARRLAAGLDFASPLIWLPDL